MANQKQGRFDQGSGVVTKTICIPIKLYNLVIDYNEEHPKDAIGWSQAMRAGIRQCLHEKRLEEMDSSNYETTKAKHARKDKFKLCK